MTTLDLLLGILCAALGVAVVALALSLRKQRQEAARQLQATRDDAEQLRARIDALALAVSEPVVAEEFVITDIDTPKSEPSVQVERIEGRLFADIVLRESVVKVAAFSHGVRRALAPETRNRIRFEMKREVKRSRKQRKLLEREVRREVAARQRAALKLDRDAVRVVAEGGS